jgi:exopolysaccharide biosynthesis polyprenyl glycosylphosphotransferase
MNGEAQAGRAQRRLQLERLTRLRGVDEAVPVPVPVPESDRSAAADISPVWEVIPQADVPGTKALRARDATFRRALGVSDVIAGYAALVLALEVMPGAAARLRLGALLLAPFILFVSKALGLYDRDQHRLSKTTVDEAPQLLQLAMASAMAVWLTEAFAIAGRLSRGQVFALVLANFALTLISRASARMLALRVTSPERCLVVGHSTDAERTRAKLAMSAGANAVIVGHVCIGPHEDCGPAPLGEARDLPTTIRRHRIERVIVAPDGHDEDEILNCIRLVKARGVKVSVLPRLLEVVGSSSVFDDIHGMTLLGVRQYGLSKSSEILKRAMDIAGSVAALVVLLPLLAILAVAIKIDSRGPVFFRQPRIGRRGERFWMIKFRSMVDHADKMKDQIRTLNEAEGGLFKIEGDPRITRVGGFLRRTSLDELPQLFNVLLGEMSLVGPRPLVQDEDALIEGWQRRRLAVKPGMTGLWQIFGSARIPMPEMVKIDYVYGANWSIWLDLKILLRTVPYVLGRRGL